MHNRTLCRVSFSPNSIIQDPTEPPIEGTQHALAFTKEQYAIAERIMGFNMVSYYNYVILFK